MHLVCGNILGASNITALRKHYMSKTIAKQDSDINTLNLEVLSSHKKKSYENNSLDTGFSCMLLIALTCKTFTVSVVALMVQAKCLWVSCCFSHMSNNQSVIG